MALVVVVVLTLALITALNVTSAHGEYQGTEMTNLGMMNHMYGMHSMMMHEDSNNDSLCDMCGMPIESCPHMTEDYMPCHIG